MPLRLAEDKCEESDARAKQLEKQAALRVASQNHGGRRVDVLALHTEAEIAREEATSSLEHLHKVEFELNSLKTVTSRLILTREEIVR
ncbi:unnamed protein product [Arabidopsis thaliana]|uniref:Uncharacterized protein n=1 Tax=Arabidopsis thaliana TaxID=3702 RepID=A0A654FME3_ARATH|nr:unnamed protein product [Arabidopsis thaliana]